MAHSANGSALPSLSGGAPPAPLRMANPFWNRRLGTLWAAALIVPLLVFIAGAATSWTAIEREARTRVTRTVDMLHEHTVRSFDTQEAILEGVERRLESRPAPEFLRSVEFHEFLRGLAKRSAPLGGLIVVGPDGRMVANSNEFPATPVDLSARDYVQVDRRGGETHLGEVVVSRPSGLTVFTVSRAIDGVDRRIVVSTFKSGYFEAFYRTILESDEDVVALVRTDRRLLARTPTPTEAAYKAPVIDSPTLERAIRDGRSFAEGRSPVDGIRRYHAFRRVTGYPLIVTYGLSRSVVIAAWRRELLVLGGVCALASLAFLLLVSRARSAVEGQEHALAAARAEAERRADAEARLRHSQRVEALGQIVGGVAHDFNNIVTAVQAGAARIEKRADDPAEVRRIAAMIRDATERGARLTGRMLAFARGDQARTDTSDVGRCLDTIRDLLGQTLGAGYSVRIERPALLPIVAADRSEFETVLVNLVINARDAMPDGGDVVISASLEQAMRDGDAESATVDLVRIAVKDTGVGMDGAVLARAAEAFFTTKAPGKGTGLGLAMARAFAESNGGDLVIESEPGRGTVVAIRLPAASTGHHGVPEKS
jgi:two-component system NtrC family sensor kinase